MLPKRTTCLVVDDVISWNIPTFYSRVLFWRVFFFAVWIVFHCDTNSLDTGRKLFTQIFLRSQIHNSTGRKDCEGGKKREKAKVRG